VSFADEAHAPEKKPFADQVVVVTGARGLIGRALCQGFLKDGACVVGIGRHAEPLDDALWHSHDTTRYFGTDLSHAGKCTEVIDAIVEEWSRIDVLVNAAGICREVRFLETNPQEWVDAVSVNLLSVVACTHAVLPRMITQRHGRIVNFATRLSAHCPPGLAAYGVSKNALSLLTRSLAKELFADHPYILVNDIIPGLTRAGAVEGAQRPEAVYPFVREMVLLDEGTRSGQVYFRGRWYEYHSSFDSLDADPPDSL
jgi:3-oxoacyl-[acyl-carrier protein] reductase